MKNFKKYDGKSMEDWGCYMSEEAKGFVRAFKNYLKRNLPGCTLEGFRPNHYDTSGFVTKPDGKVVYVSYSLNRRGGDCVADFADSSCMNGVLYRTARDTRDYTGGQNHFTSINRMAEAILALLGG